MRANVTTPERRWRQREDRVGYLMLLPALLPYLLFAVVPIIWLAYYSLFRWNGFTAPEFIGADNYARVARDGEWWGSVLTTLKFAGGRLVIELPLGFALAYIFFRGVRGGALYRTLYFLPHVLSPAIVGIIFGYFLRQVGGPANRLLDELGLIRDPIDFLGNARNALLSLIGVGSWANVGIIMLLFFAGMTQIPKEMTESAELDGAGEWKIARYVVVPMLVPVTRVVVLISLIGFLRSFDLVKTLTDGGPAGSTEVMFTYLYRFFFEPNAVPQTGYAAALGITASAVVGIVSIGYLRASRAEET